MIKNKYIYLVEYNGKVSSDGYIDVDEAINFIEQRVNIKGYKYNSINFRYWKDVKGNIYKILDVKIV